jgi:Ser-tRNA(Ala) deacylase AlaX
MEISPKKDYHAPMHTAEHILNQTMVRMFDCGRSFSNHIERKKSKCDYKFSRALSDEEISLIEEKVNETIGRSLEVSDEILSLEEAKQQYNLAKVPENNGAKIRIVHIGDYDSCPCIGKHVSNTNEIGRFKITTSNFDNGVLRIRYKLLSD